MSIHNLLLATVLASAIGAAPPSAGAQPAAGSEQGLPLWQQLDSRKLKLRSEAALLVDRFGNTLFERDAESPRPIASLTKLMTAIVILDSGLSLDEVIEITKADRDLLRLTGSRLHYGARLTRKELLTLALMSSENRAAAALARTFPGGTESFVREMNTKAKTLRMHDSRFVDAAGLDAGNIATPRDLARLVFAAMRYQAIRQATTQRRLTVRPYAKRGPLKYVNTNRLLRNKRWDIQVSKTGYINEAGRCLVMHTEFEGTPTVMVLLNSFGKLTPFGDANRIRKWIEGSVDRQTDPRVTAEGSAQRGDESGSG